MTRITADSTEIVRKRLLPALAFALAGSLVISCSHRSPASSERQLTTIVGVATSPVLSRDGATLVFAARPDNHSNPQIWMSRLDQPAPPVQLTSDAAQNYDPEFAPDGRSVFYTSSRTPRGIYRVPVLGGPSELVIEEGSSVKISPDGQILLYGRGLVLYRRAIDGGSSTPLLPAMHNSYAPAWSPDSSRIMVTAKDPGDPDPEWWIVQRTGASHARPESCRSFTTRVSTRHI